MVVVVSWRRRKEKKKRSVDAIPLLAARVVCGVVGWMDVCYQSCLLLLAGGIFGLAFLWAMGIPKAGKKRGSVQCISNCEWYLFTSIISQRMY